MFTSEVIKYPTRAKANEAVARLNKNPEITRIDISDYGRTLTLTLATQSEDGELSEVTTGTIHDEHSSAFASQDGDDFDDYDDADAFVQPRDLPGAPPVEEFEEATDDGTSEHVEDLLGTTAAVEPVEAPAAVEPEPGTPEAPQADSAPVEPGDETPAVPDVSDASRAELRETVEQWGLDVEIPGSGALAPVREKVAEALAAIDNE